MNRPKVERAKLEEIINRHNAACVDVHIHNSHVGVNGKNRFHHSYRTLHHSLPTMDDDRSITPTTRTLTNRNGSAEPRKTSYSGHTGDVSNSVAGPKATTAACSIAPLWSCLAQDSLNRGSNRRPNSSQLFSSCGIHGSLSMVQCVLHDLGWMVEISRFSRIQFTCPPAG